MRHWPSITTLITPRRLYLAALLILLCTPCETWARVGGGGNFGGGSSGGYSGGGGSGDGGVIIYLLIRLCFEYPLIGIPLTLVVGYLFVIGGKKGTSSYQEHVIVRGATRCDTAINRNEKSKLMQRDSAFDEVHFIERVKQTFTSLQGAWSQQSMEPVRSLMSDAVYDRLNLNLKLNRANGYINKITDIDIKDAHVVSYSCDNSFDVIIVSISANANDYYVKEGSQKRHGLTNEIFREYWSFLRKPGVKTLTKGGAIEGFCPNCGAPLSLSDKTACRSCKALITSGEYDWVLSEITQAKAFQHRNPTAVAGAAQLQQRDPGLNIQYLEDRASIMFWRYHAARYFCDTTYLSKIANTHFLQSHADEFKLDANQKRTFAQNLAVGSAEVIRFDQRENYDRCHAVITWSGSWQSAKMGPGELPSYSDLRIYKYAVTMVRHSDASSDPSHALSANSCAGCGAPESIDANHSCRYCGIPLNDGSKNWVMESIGPYRYENYRAAIGEAAANLPSADEAPLYNIPVEEVIAALIIVMDSDGKRDAKERTTLIEMANKLNVSQQLFNAIEQRVKTEPDFRLNLKDSREVQIVLRQLIRLSLVDGQVCNAERRAIKKLLVSEGISDVDINMMIAKERKALYRETKRKLKESNA